MFNFIRKIKRFIEYGKLSLRTEDYDAHSLYTVMHFQADRLSKFMHSNRTHTLWTDDHNSKQMRELRETVELLDRLKKDEFTQHWDKVYYKHGGTLDWSTPPEICEDYYKKSHRAIKKDGKEKNERIDRLYYLLKKRIDYWWD